MRNMRNRIALSITALALGIVGLIISTPQLRPASLAAWVIGDVFGAVGNGSYKVYSNAGAFKETIMDGFGGFTTGCGFSPTQAALYTTNFSNGRIVKYDDADPHMSSSFATAGQSSPESIAFKMNGGYFVGGPSAAAILEYDSADNLVMTYSVAGADFTGGTDWIDLAINQTTLFYTGEGRTIKRYDTVLGQLADFVTLPGSGNAFAIRLLPPFDGSGGLLVADGGNVKRLNASGTVIQTYSVTGAGAFFGLNLDPDGTSFWTGSFDNGVLYQFDIATGGADNQLQTVDTGGGGNTLFGVCLKGEITGGGGGGGHCGVLYAADGAGGNENCHLFILNPADGSVVQDVGPIGFAVTGLAFDPTTGVLYGSTGREGSNPSNLITINPVNGAGTLVGPYNATCGGGGGAPEGNPETMADLTFASDGTLYGWAEPGCDRLYTINKATGAATEVGPSGLSTSGSGLGANSSNVIYFAGSGDNGPLRTIDRTTGAPMNVATMSGGFSQKISALAFDPSDTLYGADLPGGGMVEGIGSSHLITINTTSGVITDHGATIDNLDAIVFGPCPSPTPSCPPLEVHPTAAPATVSAGQNATFTVSSIHGPGNCSITVHYSMSGNAILGSDYTLSGTPGQVTIPAGSSTGTVTLTANSPHAKKVTAQMNLTSGNGYVLSNKAKFRKAVVKIRR